MPQIREKNGCLGNCLFFTVLGIMSMFLSVVAYTPPASNRITQSFNTTWKYYQGDASGADAQTFTDASWTAAVLPHYTKWISPDDDPEYLGIAWYRKHFTLPATAQGKKIFIEFEGAMQWAQVWVNGVSQGTHEGGYMGFVFDITKNVSFTGENVIAVKIDTRANANWGPGSASIDFRYYGGLYRDAWLHITDPVHVTHALFANKVAGGGVFVTYTGVTTTSATVTVKTDVINEGSASSSCSVTSDIVDAAGAIAGTATTTATVASGASNAFSQEVIIANPKLWNHLTPNLYTVHTIVKNGTQIVDYAKTRVGIRTIQWTRTSGIKINGTSYKLRGVDYHQDAYGLGNALPNSAIFGEVKMIKEAGFDFIRCCHYPHDPAFYDACDSLGIMVMNALAGWHSFPNTTTFNNNTYKECRDMVRRDRNHPCVIVWETSLNETGYDATWAQNVHTFAHAEYPGDQMYTNGWRTTVFDIFSDAAGNDATQPIYNDKTTRPVIIAEYGDYEYQSSGTSGRVKRESGDASLLTEAANYQRRMNLDRNQSWFSADCVWSWGDDGSAYSKGMFYGGITDMYRLPKFTYYFFQSQRDPTESVPGANLDPMVYIANTWQASSPTTVKVFSNCESVSLYKNGTLVATRKPDSDANSGNLSHPPFTFSGVSFTSGTLKAEGLIGGAVKATHSRTTPGSAATVRLRSVLSDPLVTDGSDARLVWVEVVDANGTVVPSSIASVALSVTSPATIVGPTSITMKGGQLATWVRAGTTEGVVSVTATSSGLAAGTLTFKAGTIAVAQTLPAFTQQSFGKTKLTLGKTGLLVKMQFQARVHLKIVRFDGKVVAEQSSKPDGSFFVSLKGIPKGVYVVQIKDNIGNKVSTQRELVF